MPMIRIEFYKQGNAKYISHLDLLRTVQRSVRRAGIPVEYSRGFNPHSKISYGPALAVGISSSREYLDMEIDRQMDQSELMERLNTALPTGLGATAAIYIPDRAPSLTSVINAALYSIDGRVERQGEHFEQRLKCFFTADNLLIQKTDKKGREKQVDIAPMILGIEKILVHKQRITMELILETGSKNNLKPADLLKAIEKETQSTLEEIKIHRERLLVKRGERYFSPMEIFE